LLITIPFETNRAEPVREQLQIDEEIIRSLISLGMGNDEEIRAALLSEESNLTQAYYRLLMARKMKVVDASFEYKPKLNDLTRGRGNTAPILNSTLSNPFSNCDSPPKVSPEPSPPSSPTVFRTRSDSSPRILSPRLAAIPMLKERRLSNASTPVAILPQHSRFQKIKIEDMAVPGSPIIGSSPKKSWFSSFFSKVDRETQQPAAHGIYTKKPVAVITSELQRTLKKMSILYEIENAQLIRARSRVPEIKFDIEIVRAGMDGSHFVNFIFQRGAPEDYNTLCTAIETEMEIIDNS